MPERKDTGQELIELLNELRVTLPGVQVLFAFLLAVPFTSRWSEVTGAQRLAFTVSLLSTTAGTVLLIAPSAYHRMRWREAGDEEVVRTSNRLSIAGQAFVALAMTSAVYLVTDLRYGLLVTVVVVSATATLFAWFWYGLAFVRRGSGRRGSR